MIRKLNAALIAVGLLFAGSAQGQTFTDNSDAKLPPELRTKLMAALQSDLREPERTKIRGLHQIGPAGWCSEMNTPNKFGGLSGFKLLYFYTKTSLIMTEESLMLVDPSGGMFEAVQKSCEVAKAQ